MNTRALVFAFLLLSAYSVGSAGSYRPVARSVTHLRTWGFERAGGPWRTLP